MKTLIKWFVKRYVSVDAIKGYIHDANAKLAESAKVDDGKARIIAYGEDAAHLTGAYLTAFADDGKINPATELPAITAECDKVVDKYITDKIVDGLIERIFG